MGMRGELANIYRVEVMTVNHKYRNEGLSAWIGATIHRLRELRGWSQYELADKARIARSYLSHIENGYKTPSIAMLEKIAAALRVPMSAFFDDRIEFLVGGFGRELLYELMALGTQQRSRAIHTLAIIAGVAEPASGRLRRRHETNRFSPHIKRGMENWGRLPANPHS